MHSSAPGVAWQLLLIPEYSGINKGQRIHEKSKTAHRKPSVKCFLTHFQVPRIALPGSADRTYRFCGSHFQVPQITPHLVQCAIHGNKMLNSLPIAVGGLIPHIHKYLIKGQQRSA